MLMLLLNANVNNAIVNNVNDDNTNAKDATAIGLHLASGTYLILFHICPDIRLFAPVGYFDILLSPSTFACSEWVMAYSACHFRFDLMLAVRSLLVFLIFRFPMCVRVQ